VGQGVYDNPVPQQDQQKDGCIAGEFHIGGRKAGHQPVLRQPQCANCKPEDRCQDDTDRRDKERIEQSDKCRPQMSRLRTVIDQRLIDIVIGGQLPQETKTKGFVERREICGDVAEQPGDQREYQQHPADLQRDETRRFLTPDGEGCHAVGDGLSEWRRVHQAAPGPHTV
jgi:hypothetical protein